MSNRFVVSTDCPTCGGHLDFSEGANAIQCQFCRSNLLVTGRKQILSYYIAPKLPVQRAVAKIMLAHKADGTPCRVLDPQQYFIPYYRLLGHDLRMELKTEKKDKPSSGSSFYGNFFLGNSQGMGGLAGLIGGGGISQFLDVPKSPFLESESEETRFLGVPSAKFNPRKDMIFRDRYVQKNFVAVRLHGQGMYSLGVRPGVLKLELFHAQKVTAFGTIVKIQISPKEALSHAMKTAQSRRILFRQVMGQFLSIIYFPFWIVKVRRKNKEFVTVLDGVSGSVVQLKVTGDLHSLLHHQAEESTHVLGFRPLVCPNCGWDLPIQKDNIIFFCNNCRKAWQINGPKLYEVPYQISKPENLSVNDQAQFLPFWILLAKMGNAPPTRYYLPAFRFGRLKSLNDLANILTYNPPKLVPFEGKEPKLHGCFYDQEDAVKLAQMTFVSSAQKSKEAIEAIIHNKVKLLGIALSWIPFTTRGPSLIEPTTGYAIPRNLLK